MALHSCDAVTVSAAVATRLRADCRVRLPGPDVDFIGMKGLPVSVRANGFFRIA